MSTTRHLLKANLRAHLRRYVAMGVAVGISLVFLSLALNFAHGMNATIHRQFMNQITGTSVMIDSSPRGADLSGAPSLIEKVDGVQTSAYLAQSVVEAATEKGSLTFPIVNTLPEPFEQISLSDGALPQGDSEIVVPSYLAELAKISVGDTISITHGLPAQSVNLRVSGIADSGFVDQPYGYMTRDALKNNGMSHTILRIYVSGTDPENSAESQTNLAENLRQALSASPEAKEANVVTYEQAAKEIKETAQEAFGAVFIGIMVFPAIAAVVALIVVNSTFQVVLHQRKREMALLRAVGARTGQLRRIIIAESLSVGAIASTLALLIGSAASVWALQAAGVARSTGEAASLISPWATLALLLCGTILTLLVSLRPALGAARISPMAALSPVEESPLRGRRVPRLRVGAATLILLGSLAGMYYMSGHSSDELRFLALVGLSFVTLIALLVLTSAALPYVTHSLGRVSGSLLSQLARENTSRNPRRTSATGTAIIIGVTLMVTMMVGASSMNATLSAELDSRRPLDFEITISEDADIQAVRREVEKVDHVEATAIVRTLTVPFKDLGHVIVAGQPDLAPVLHTEKPLLSAGEIAVNDTDLSTPGETIILPGKDGADTSFTTTEKRSYLSMTLSVPDAELDQLGDAKPTVVLAKIDDITAATQVQTALNTIDGVEFVSGSAVERQMYSEVISALLTVILALVGVSVLVAVVGVSNTLNLSVRERTRENGLLRALGLTRRQMRRLLTLEALLIAVSATALGTVFGVFFAWVGMYALPMRIETVHMSLPWGQLAGVLAVAVVCALAASFIPGRKAAQVSPVQALAAL